MAVFLVQAYDTVERVELEPLVISLDDIDNLLRVHKDDVAGVDLHQRANCPGGRVTDGIAPSDDVRVAVSPCRVCVLMAGSASVTRDNRLILWPSQRCYR